MFPPLLILATPLPPPPFKSYGSRCVRPPIIYGAVSRPKAMTIREFKVAQALTSRPVKGMLTGPVTTLNWSFVRTDVSRKEQVGEKQIRQLTFF